MNILLFTLEYPPFKGGVAGYYYHLVKYWPEPNKIYILNNNENHLIEKFCFPKWLPSLKQLFITVKKYKIDHLLVGHILPLGTAVYLISKLIKLKYSVILHGMDLGYAIKNKRKKFIADIILRNAKHIICANNYTANLIKINFAKFDNTKITVVNPGVDLPPTIVQKQLDNFKKKHQLHNKIVLFSLGRLVRRKGFDMVLGAMPEVLKIVPDLWYYIAGTGPDENYLRNMAQSLKNVTFLGEIEENDKWLWFYFCDIFIMPAREIDGDYEGFGIVFLEANIMGKPVIAGDSGGQKDAVQNALNGLIINPYSQEKIASAIIMLATERNTAQTMGENGRRIVLEKFNWSKQVNLFYQTIIN